MTIITSGDVRIVDTFHAIRDSQGFWKDIERDGVMQFMTCLGDPFLAMRFNTAEEARVYAEENAGLGHGNADIVKVEVTTKIEEVKF